MPSKRATKWLLAAGSLLAGSMGPPGWLVSSAQAESRWGADYFPDLPLVTQDGKTVRLWSDLLKDKIVAVDLIYTRCTYSCPLETARLAQVQKLLGDRVGKDIFFYSISIDPTHDTPRVLKAYAKKFHAGPGWTFLTGKPEDIKRIARKLGLVADPKLNADGHIPDLMIGDVATGQWLRNSAVDNARFLAITITRLLDGWTHHDATVKAYAEAAPLSIPSKGQYLFSTKCIVCHTMGKGDGIGPDLQGVTRLRDHAWLARFLAHPDEMLAERDPTTRALWVKYKRVNMPNLGLGPEDVEALIAYLEAPGGPAGSPSP